MGFYKFRFYSDFMGRFFDFLEVHQKGGAGDRPFMTIKLGSLGYPPVFTRGLYIYNIYHTYIYIYICIYIIVCDSIIQYIHKCTEFYRYAKGIKGLNTRVQPEQVSCPNCPVVVKKRNK